MGRSVDFIIGKRLRVCVAEVDSVAGCDRRKQNCSLVQQVVRDAFNVIQRQLQRSAGSFHRQVFRRTGDPFGIGRRTVQRTGYMYMVVSSFAFNGHFGRNAGDARAHRRLVNALAQINKNRAAVAFRLGQGGLLAFVSNGNRIVPIAGLNGHLSCVERIHSTNVQGNVIIVVPGVYLHRAGSGVVHADSVIPGSRGDFRLPYAGQLRADGIGRVAGINRQVAFRDHLGSHRIGACTGIDGH